MLAVALVAVFIVHGLLLISRSRQLQHKTTGEIELLNELNRLNASLDQLGLVHRTDVGTRRHRWPVELKRVDRSIADLGSRQSSSPALSGMPTELKSLLHQADSIHHMAMTHRGAWSEQRPNEVVFRFLMQRAKDLVDGTSRSVLEQNLAACTTTLSESWDEAQLLLVAACLIAVVFAWLVNTRERLLQQSRLRAEQLDTARQHLERTNRELRETMLSKEEKEVMLKEIHHRVKNNLQIVKSLIRFQMEQVSDPATTELFNECVNRVSAMALVHEQTYLSKDLANIDVNSYLAHLTSDLCHAYTIDIELEKDIRIDVPTMSVDTLIPLGLLINEVISNSLKYAFKGRRKGTIVVHVDGHENGLHMRIGDDGIGLPDRSRWERPNSLGMDLIHTLAGQLDADIHLLEGPGTQYELISQRRTRKQVA